VRRIVRAFAVVLVTAGATSTVSSCTSDDVRPSPTGTTGTATNGGCRVPAVGPVEPASVLVPGPTSGLPPSDAGGQRLTIVATVLDAKCAPASKASVTAWHTDARGEYGPRDTDICCYYRGTVAADTNGRFRIDTIRPAQYPQANAPAAHIHLDIQHASGRLETEIVFTDDPGPPAPVRPSRQVPVTLQRVAGANGDSWHGEAVFAVAP
jgi:protocatechuate 3,4-dioxygenase beta subunit